MKAKKMSMFLAVVFGVGMMLCGIASAETDQSLAVYFEIPIQGKGIIYSRVSSQTLDATATDNPYMVEKHAIEKGATLYIEIDRTKDEENVLQVSYDADNETWRGGAEGCAKPTEDGYIVQLSNDVDDVSTKKKGIYVEKDGIGIKAKVFAQVTLKEKEGKDAKGRFKQLGGTYWGCNDQKDVEGEPHIKKAGALKAKGKLVLFDDLPQAVQDLFDPPPPL
jgi:hypothetical protein